MHRSSRFKLGRSHHITDSRTLRMERFMGPDLPAPPPSRDWLVSSSGQPIGPIPMFGNDQYGDCTFASAACARGLWTFWATGSPLWTPDQDLTTDYLDFTGGQDSGCDELRVLKHWRNAGICGDRIGAFGTIPLGNSMLLRQAIDIFGGVKLDLDLPDDWEKQLPSSVWTISTALPDPDNGHSVWATGYPDSESIWIDTWTQRVRLDGPFIEQAIVAAFAVVSPDWLEADGEAPSGFDVNGLNAALARVAA